MGNEVRRISTVGAQTEEAPNNLLEIDMQRGSPFRAFQAMAAAIAVIMQSGAMSHEKTAQINALGEYKSRGKGRGSPSRNFYRNRSKYQPGIHGDRQVARRQRQGFHMDVVNGFLLMQRDRGTGLN